MMMVGFGCSLSHRIETDTALLLLLALPHENTVDAFLCAIAVTGLSLISTCVLVYNLDIVLPSFRECLVSNIPLGGPSSMNHHCTMFDLSVVTLCGNGFPLRLCCLTTVHRHQNDMTRYSVFRFAKHFYGLVLTPQDKTDHSIHT